MKYFEGGEDNNSTEQIGISIYKNISFIQCKKAYIGMLNNHLSHTHDEKEALEIAIELHKNAITEKIDKITKSLSLKGLNGIANKKDE